MLKTAFLSIVLILASFSLHAAESILIESEGSVCLEGSQSKQGVEEKALQQAKAKALENALRHIQDTPSAPELRDRLVDSFKKSEIKIVNELGKAWEKKSVGECFRIKVLAEVLPDQRKLADSTRGLKISEKSNLPLRVKVWTDKPEYKDGEKVKVYLQGNKPFYARVLYKDAKGNLLQVLPNPFRQNNHFTGEVIYEIPSMNDRFDLEVAPPFGREEFIVYASTNPLGEINITSAGGVFEIKTPFNEIGNRSRGIGGVVASPNTMEKQPSKVGEFFESKLIMKVGQ